MYTLLVYRTLDEEKKCEMREDIVRNNTKEIVSHNPDYWIEAVCFNCLKNNNRYYAHHQNEICQDDKRLCLSCCTTTTEYNTELIPNTTRFQSL